MTQQDTLAFTALFKEAWFKCFGQALENPVSETESKLFCNQVLDHTGLSIGWKSVKNYSLFITGSHTKPENPSVATLDTLARYVLSAPYTSELKRKAGEGHHPYWFLYREKFNKSPQKATTNRWSRGIGAFAGGIVLIILSLLLFKYTVHNAKPEYSDDFKNVESGVLMAKGWFLKDTDENYWKKNAVLPGQLTLYTLKGDNWPDPANRLAIHNLLLRAIPYDCFTAEVHLNNFIPREEWQQAGILLLEDTMLTGKSIRLSIAYNDYFAGERQPKEVLIQAITSLGNGFGKPEEIAHKPVLFLDSAISKPVLLKNMQHSALRIEKQGNRFRFLYSGGVTDNGAFKEVAVQNFDMKPKYIGLFAIKGFKDTSAIIPAHFTFFRIASNPCE